MNIKEIIVIDGDLKKNHIADIVNSLKLQFDIFVIVNNKDDQTKVEGVTYVNKRTSYALYLRTVSKYILETRNSIKPSRYMNPNQNAYLFINDKCDNKEHLLYYQMVYKNIVCNYQNEFTIYDENGVKAKCASIYEVMKHLEVHSTKRLISEVVFLVDHLNSSSKMHRKILDESKKLKKEYNCSCYVIGVKEFLYDEEQFNCFRDSDYVDMKLIYEKNIKTSKAILNNTTGILLDWREKYSNILFNKSKRSLLSKVIRRVKKYALKFLNKVKENIGILFLKKGGKISFIIPYYNSEKTIYNTIESIRNLRYKNTEIIIVNDGSAPCDFSEFEDVKYYHKEKNDGPGLTRNLGIEKATGEYIMFLDSDDIACKNGASYLVDYQIRNDVDVVSGVCKRYLVGENKKKTWFESIYDKNYINTEKERYLLLRDALSTNKLYKASLFKDMRLRFERGLYEDKLFTSILYTTVDKIGIINKDVFLWNIHELNSSISTTITLENFNERFKRVDQVLESSSDLNKKFYLDIMLKHDFKIALRNINVFNENEQYELFMMMKEIYEKWKKNICINDIIELGILQAVKSLDESDFTNYKIIAKYISSYA